MKRSKIIIIISIVAAVFVIVVLLSLNARPYLSVTEVTQNPSKYNGNQIQVIGIVENFNNNTDSFYLTENELKLNVNISSVNVPNNLVNGMEIVVTGILINSTILIASQILTQCS
jgi:cytochrome c-type biogenesis protein CcmE